MIDLSFRDKQFRIVEKFLICLIISAVVVLTGLVFMIVRGMNIGVEFGGGANVEVTVANVSEIKGYDSEDFKNHFLDWLTERGFNVNKTVQTSGVSTYEYRIGTTIVKDGKEIDLNTTDPESENGETYLTTETRALEGEMETAVVEYLRNKYNLSEEEFTNEGATSNKDKAVVVDTHSIGNQVMKSIIRSAVIAVSVAIVVMLAYIAIRFTWIAGLAAILALVHDVLIMVALTTVFYVPVNSTFIAAIITIIGYSINATIVVFDRIREIERQPSSEGLTDREIANAAVTNTLSRSVLTTLTTLVMIVMLAIFGTASIREFAFPIIFGLIAGAYSSVLLSAPIWVKLRKLFKAENVRPKKKAKKKAAVSAEE